MGGSKTQAQDGTLVILVAGDRSLFDDCQSCFQAMGKNSFYLGEVGNASKMNLVLQTMVGVTLAGLAEGMALADRAGLQQKDVMEVLELTGLACPTILGKGKAIIDGGFPTHQPLQHMQKDLKLSLNMAISWSSHYPSPPLPTRYSNMPSGWGTASTTSPLYISGQDFERAREGKKPTNYLKAYTLKV